MREARNVHRHRSPAGRLPVLVLLALAAAPLVGAGLGSRESAQLTVLLPHHHPRRAHPDHQAGLGRAQRGPDRHQPAGDAPIEKHFEVVPIVEGMVDDPTTAAVVADWEARLDGELAVAVGATREPLNAVAEEVRSGESNLGNLFADAMRRETGAEVAILNAGSIRSNRVYPPGELTRRDLIAMHPFGGKVCQVEVSGAALAEALEHGFSRLGESAGRFPQLSGVRVEVDPGQPVGERLVDATVGGRPLDPERLYHVAIPDYLLEGGDGYSVFENARVLAGPEEGSMLVTVLEQTIRQRQPLAPRVEGRIGFLGEPPPARTARRRPVLLDTDMGIDSVMGLLYLLKA
ncbi:MAG: bifunctional metallophosphatase/5'-nucleotidase, partial [Thermoanaerobaculia bacterium]